MAKKITNTGKPMATAIDELEAMESPSPDTMNLNSTARVCEMLQILPHRLDDALRSMRLEATLTLNDVEYFDRAAIERVSEWLEEQAARTKVSAEQALAKKIAHATKIANTCDYLVVTRGQGFQQQNEKVFEQGQFAAAKELADNIASEDKTDASVWMVTLPRPARGAVMQKAYTKHGDGGFHWLY